MSSIPTEKHQIVQWLTKEALAREAVKLASNLVEQDEHYIQAERYADSAWSLAETNDHAFVASAIWR